MKKFIQVLTLLTCSFKVYSLAIDEKLPVRVLKTSQSKKTILINRGIEDGLVVGDHAKFFISSGILARGVVVKTSPTRSVWSIYRLINGNGINPETVMKLKISEPIKLTNDPTKMISSEDLPEYNRGRLRYYNSKNIPYYNGRVIPEYGNGKTTELVGEGVPLDRNVGDNELDKLENAYENNPSEYSAYRTSEFNESRLTNKYLEIYGNINLNSLNSSVSSTESSEQDFEGSFSTFDVTAGFQFYFDSTSFLRKFSLFTQLHKATQQTTSVEGVSAESDIFEIGIGTNFHFQDPFLIRKMIFFLTLGYGIGESSDVFTTGQDTATATESSADGSIEYYNFGGGLKYLFNERLSLTSVLDYYSRTETYEFDDSNTKEKYVSGPRFVLGVGFRF